MWWMRYEFGNKFLEPLLLFLGIIGTILGPVEIIYTIFGIFNRYFP